MSSWTEPIDFNDYIAVSLVGSDAYANTVKAETASNGGSYQDNSKKIKGPRSKHGSSFITLPRPKPALSGRY